MNKVQEETGELDRLRSRVAELEATVARLREVEEKSYFKSLLLDTVEEAVIATGLDGRITYWNRFAQKLYGWSSEEALGRNIVEVTPTEMNRYQASEIMQQLSAGMSWSGEFMVRRKNGSSFMACVTDVPIYNHAGEMVGVVGVSYDTTRVKQAEERLRTSLQEKEVLLKEIHHRVKNNMQIISSLLMLQSRCSKDPRVLELFEESRNRVHSMALIHEQLYQTENLARIDLKEYSQELAARLLEAYRDGASRVEFAVSGEKLLLNINTAIPCGLILNELISNSLKYAFPDGRPGRIELELWGEREEMENIRLVLRDNGVGLPAGLDFNSSETLGLRLVKTLVAQLNGTIYHNRQASGTEFVVTANKERPAGTIYD